MAKFRNGNLVLTNSQNIRIGDITLSRNANGEFESNVAFVAPDSTSSNTLATRAYVDSVAGGGGGGLFTEDGSNNIVGGTGAGASFTSASNNFIAGVNGGAGLTSGSQNIFIGTDSGRYEETGTGNVAIGYQSLQSLSATTFGSGFNVAVGYQAMQDADNADFNIAIGAAAFKEATSGQHCIAIGTSSLNANQTADRIIAIGGFAASSVLSQTEGSVYIGYSAGQELGSGDGGNVVIGNLAAGGSIADSGTYSKSVIIGANAAGDLNFGEGNVIIGYSAYETATDATNVLIIANNSSEALIEGNFANRTLQVNGTLTVETLITDATSVIIGNTILTEKSGGGLLVDGAEVGGGLFTEDTDGNIIGGTNAGANITGGSGLDNFLGGVNAGNALTTGDNNVAIGDNAMQNNQTGNNNVVIGADAGVGSGTTITSSVLIGQNAGNSLGNTTASTLIGYTAGQNLSSPTRATMIGYQAGSGASVTSNWWCTFVGYRAGVNMSGNNNTVIGADAGTAVSTATGNVFVGTRSGEDNTGQDNAFVGANSGANSDDGDYCVYIGSSAGNYMKSDFNVAIGYLTMQGDSVGGTSTGNSNTYVGYRCAESITTAQRNAGVGYNVHNAIDTGQYNVAMGYSADNGLENGNNNVAIGYDVGPGFNNDHSDDVLIGYQVAQNLDSNAQQNVLIGSSVTVTDSTSTNRIALGYAVDVDADNKAVIGNSSVTTIGGYATWTDYSDRSIKTNIQDSDIGIEFIRRLRTRRFEKKDQPGKMHDGLIAQEVKEVMDELGIDFSGWVEPGSNGLQMLQYPTFVMPLINAATKQQEELESLRSEVETLKRQMSEIIGQLKK